MLPLLILLYLTLTLFIVSLTWICSSVTTRLMMFGLVRFITISMLSVFCLLLLNLFNVSPVGVPKGAPTLFLYVMIFPDIKFPSVPTPAEFGKQILSDIDKKKSQPGYTPEGLLNGSPFPDSSSQNLSDFGVTGDSAKSSDVGKNILDYLFGRAERQTFDSDYRYYFDYFMQFLSAQMQNNYNSAQSDLAYERQRYETDLAYDRTKFATLFNQFLAAGMSPAAALQAASGSSVDTSGSAPSAPSAAGTSIPSYTDTLTPRLNALNNASANLSGVAQQFAALSEQQRQFNSSLAQHKYEYNVDNFDAIQAFNGSNDFYENVAPLFYTRDKYGFLPFNNFSANELTPTGILTSLEGSEFTDLYSAIDERKDNPYFQASLRNFLRSEIGSRGYAMNQRNLELHNQMSSTQIHAQEIGNKLANYSLADHRQLTYAVLTSAVNNDPEFRSRYGIYWNGTDWTIPECTFKNGDVLNDVSFMDYIQYMESGMISAAQLQGLSYNDVLRLKSDYMSLSLQTDPDLYQRSLQTMKNNAGVAQNMSALDFILSQSIYGGLKDSKTLDTFVTWRTYLDMSGISGAAQWTADKAIQLYGIKSMNKRAALDRQQNQTQFERSLEQRSSGTNGYQISY